MIKPFWSRAKRVASGCLEWQEHRSSDGYGKTKPPGERRGVLAHRYAWELTNGPIPDGHYVLHRCDNPACIEPSHLFTGTQAANMADMVAKGRANKPTGTRNPRATLNESQVIAIRQRRGAGEQLKSIAQAFGTTISTVFNIANRRTWSHLP